MSELNLSSLENALKQLEDGLQEAKLYPNDALRRDGVIQRFKYSMDLSCKMIQRYLKAIAQMDESNIRTKKDLFREAARLKLIVDPEAWIEHYEVRNEAPNGYINETAKKIFERAVVFLSNAKILLKSLHQPIN